ncbi:enoyl-CoA hydratase/isomerase family protein, partial [candidate division KSB1 bacterium]
MSEEIIGKTIKYSIKNRVAWITLNRPEIHNAFNETMIGELLELYQAIGKMPEVRVVVITGAGKSFCAGADLNWMGGVIKYSYEQNLNESLQLAELFYTMYSLPKPTIAVVNGAAIGGGAGMVAVNDLVIASDRAKFSFSEVKLGLVPACISPYVIRRVGENRSRELFLSG